MKEGFLKSRKQFFTKTYANRALKELTQTHQIEKEHMLLEIEKLEDELEYTKQIKQKNNDFFTNYKSDYLTKDLEIQKMKKEMGELELKLSQKGTLISKQDECFGSKYIMNLDMEKEIAM